eukprot:COSAG06_NODE_4370_length_4324_cov_36.056805_4_plen_84_part_00
MEEEEVEEEVEEEEVVVAVAARLYLSVRPSVYSAWLRWARLFVNAGADTHAHAHAHAHAAARSRLSSAAFCLVCVRARRGCVR